MPFYIQDLPEVEIRDDGHVIAHLAGHQFAATVHLYRKFLEREMRKLDAWDERKRKSSAVHPIKRGR